MINIVLAVSALVVSAVAGFQFLKAGWFKAIASREVMLGAGFGWIERIPLALVRVIAYLELLGAVGIVLSPFAAYLVPGFEWAKLLGVAAAAGLALVMVVAAWVHIARKEFAYTWKANVGLFGLAALGGLAQVFVTLPVLG